MATDLGPLAALGLSEVQRRAYEALTLHGERSTTGVARRLRQPRETTRQALEELVALGLALHDITGTSYLATPVEPALEALLHLRREELARAEVCTRQLARRVAQGDQRHSPEGLVSIVTGAGAIRAAQVQMQRTAVRQIRMLDRPPYVTEVAAGGAGTDPLQQERMAANVRYRTIYDQSLFDDPTSLARVRGEIAAGEDGRVLADVPLKLVLADDALAMLPLLEHGPDDEPSALLVRPSVLLDSLATLFETLWLTAKPVALRAVSPDDVDAEVRQLVELLGTGLTEDRLARLLGLSERTVRRRLTLARDTLGATTMFQAGVEAARRGWL